MNDKEFEPKKVNIKLNVLKENLIFNMFIYAIMFADE